MLKVKKTPPYLIRGSKQLAALAAAARQEIIDVLEQMGAVSVAELAAALSRPADALYFHLRTLTRAGLVQNVGYRSQGGRKESIYCTIAPELKLEYQPQNPANRRAISAIVASMLRLGIRDFSRSLQSGNVVVSGSRRELWALRKVGRLSHARLADLNRGIKRLVEEMRVPAGGDGRLYAVTVVLTPLDHRNKEAGGRIGKGKRPWERK